MTHLVLGPRKGHLYKQSRKKNFNCVIIFYSFDNLLKIVFCCVISGDAGGCFSCSFIFIFSPSFLFLYTVLFANQIWFFLWDTVLFLFCFGEKKCGIRLIFCEMLSFHLMCNSFKWELTIYLLNKKKSAVRCFFFFLYCVHSSYVKF